MIEAIVRRRVPESDVDDVVQTVLCDALANAAPPEDETELRKWVVGIARHKVADFHRKGARARHVELDDEVADEPSAQSARDLARWADKQVVDNVEAQRTLEWMEREGEGEKLAHIAAEEKLPADQVRQRVSRLRRFMREKWAAELAAVAAVIATAIAVWWFHREPTPIAKPVQPAPERAPQIAPPPKLPAGDKKAPAPAPVPSAVPSAKAQPRAIDSAPDFSDAVTPRKSAPPPVKTTPAPKKDGVDGKDVKGSFEPEDTGSMPAPPKQKAAPPPTALPKTPSELPTQTGKPTPFKGKKMISSPPTSTGI
jgi:DNA-directed RNA polymerase specialized sigma24 family protein